MHKWITNTDSDNVQQYFDRGLVLGTPRPTSACSQESLEKSKMVGVYDPNAVQDPDEPWVLDVTTNPLREFAAPNRTILEQFTVTCDLESRMMGVPTENPCIPTRQQDAMDLVERHIDPYHNAVHVDEKGTITIKKREQPELRCRWNGTRYIYEEIEG